MRAVRTSFALLLPLIFAALAVAENRVTLEVITEKGIAITALQTWSKLLDGKGADSVRLRGGRDGESVKIEELKTGSTTTYQVTAILSKNETLHLPDGAKFTKRNIGELPAWFNRIKIGGEEELTRNPGKDGMTGAEREGIREKLTKQVDIDTKGQPLDLVLGAIGRHVGLEFRASDATIAYVQSRTAKDELKGISSGTALSILLRPYGLIVVPKREVGGAIHLHVVQMDSKGEAWPIGHAPTESPSKVCPVLFQFIEVEINRTPLEKALGAITPRLKTAMFFDHYKIDQDQINMNVEVRFPKGRTFYKKILDHVLYQAMLSVDLKVDEAGTPFLWVTSAKRG